MRVRLAFSIATSIEPEILLLDEVLSAGDIAFQAKARQRMQQLIKRAQLMVLVTHDLESLNNFCDRILWMDHGKIRMLGEPNATIKAYKQFMTPTAKSATSPAAA
jgi:ABC-type polysaccharide/polyol phosphate transport system ATPase subunit